MVTAEVGWRRKQGVSVKWVHISVMQDEDVLEVCCTALVLQLITVYFNLLRWKISSCTFLP